MGNDLSKPMKPKPETAIYDRGWWWWYKCPCCSQAINYMQEKCKSCGQKIDWSEETQRGDVMTITLTDKEATLLCGLIEDEQNCCGYEQYWDDEQRELFDEIIWKLKNGFGT